MLHQSLRRLLKKPAEALRPEPQQDQPRRRQAEALRAQGLLAEAAMIHKAAIEKGGGAAMDYHQLALFYRTAAGNAEAAEITALAGLGRFPDDPYLLAEKFHLAFSRKDIATAIATAERLYAVHPTRTPGSIFLGYVDALANAGRFDDALQVLARVDRITPPVWRSRLSLGDQWPSLPGDDHYSDKRRLNTTICRILDGADKDHPDRVFAEGLYTQTAFSHRLAARGGKTLVVMLTATHRFTLQKYDFDADVLYLIDISHSYYCIPCERIARMIGGLVRQNGYRRVTFIGCSKGGTGALSIAAVLCGLTPDIEVRAFAFSPQTQVFPFNDNLVVLPSHANLHARIARFPVMESFMERTGTLSRLDYSGLSACKIIYGAKSDMDRIEAERMSGAAGVEMLAIDTGQHYTLGFFTIPKDVDLEHARARFAENDDPDVVAMRTDDAVDEYLQKAKTHGYDLRTLMA